MKDLPNVVRSLNIANFIEMVGGSRQRRNEHFTGFVPSQNSG